MTQLIQFSTSSCSQCPRQAEILKSLAAERPDVEFEKLDATEATVEANKYGVRSVPATIVLDDDGSIVSKFDGLTRPRKSRTRCNPASTTSRQKFGLYLSDIYLLRRQLPGVPHGIH